MGDNKLGFPYAIVYPWPAAPTSLFKYYRINSDNSRFPDSFTVFFLTSMVTKA